MKGPSKEMIHRLNFWRKAVQTSGSVAATDGIVAVIRSGALGGDLLAEWGAELISHALSVPTQGFDSPYHKVEIEGLSLRMSTTGAVASPHFPGERVVAALLEQGADPWKQSTHAVPMPEKSDRLPKLPILQAMEQSSLPLSSIAAFLAHPSCPPGPELDAMGYKDAMSLLGRAAYEDGRVVPLLLARGMDPNARGHDNLPALFFAGSPQSVRALLAGGADPYIRTGSDQSLPMHWALRRHFFGKDMLKELPSDLQKDRSVKLNDLLGVLEGASASHCGEIFEMLRPVHALRWSHPQVEDVDLLEAVSMRALFGNPERWKGVLTALNPKNASHWPDRSVAIHGLAKSRLKSANNKAAELGMNASDAQRLLARVVALAQVGKPSVSERSMEANEVSSVLSFWENLQIQAPVQSDAIQYNTTAFHGFATAASRLRVPQSFPFSRMFDAVRPLAEGAHLPPRLWGAWIIMGLRSKRLEETSMWQVVVDTKPPGWFDLPSVKEGIKLYASDLLRSKLEQLALAEQVSPATAQANRPRL